MDEIERYEFDRQGFLVIRDMLSATEVGNLSRAIDALEEHALSRVDLPPRKRSAWGPEYHADPERGYHVQGGKGEGRTLIIEDFWNAVHGFFTLWTGDGDGIHKMLV